MWCARVSLVPQKQHRVAMGTAALSIMGHRVHVMSMVTVSLWQMVDQVFYSSSLMFYSLPSLPYLCFYLVIYACLFIRLVDDLSVSLHACLYFKKIIYLYSFCSLSLFTKPSICLYIHSLSVKFLSSPSRFSLPGEASAAGGAGQSQEGDGGWEAQTTAAQGLTHIHGMISPVSFIHTNIHTQMQPLFHSVKILCRPILAC